MTDSFFATESTEIAAL